MKIMVTLLTSNCLPGIQRLVRNMAEINPVEGVELVPVVVVNTKSPEYEQQVLDQEFPYPVHITESNGLPGKGKNACMEVFLQSDCDFMSQIDGDDILYPTFLQSLVEHIRRFPCIDALGIIPTDLVTNIPINAGHVWQIREDRYGSVWGTSMCKVNHQHGPEEARLWNEDLPISIDNIILQSRKCAAIRMHEDLPVAEDHLYTYQLLAEHQRGNLCYFHTMSSDMYIHDRTTEDSVQDQFPQHESVELFKSRVAQVVPKWRSSAYELPAIYKELLMNHHDKERWLTDFMN